MVTLRDLNVQMVVREKPKTTVYFRSLPTTIESPTPAQSELRLKFAEVVKESKKYTVEEVARLVGGEVIEVNGKKYIRMPDGRVLMKHMAYVKYVMSGYRSPNSKVRLPKWVEMLSTIALPSARAVEELIKSK